MSAPHRRAAAAGLVLVVAGLLLWALYPFVAAEESHSFAPGQSAARLVHLHKGTHYQLGIPGGVRAARKAGVTPQALRCSAAPAGGSASSLAITAEQPDTKATNQIASFVAPFTARVHVTCSGLGAVYVDNAEADPSGYLLVSATVALVIGAPLLLAGVRRSARSRQSTPAATG